MANYTYTSDLIADVLFRGGEPASGSEYADRVLTYLNRGYQALITGGSELEPTVDEKWSWLKNQRPLLLQLQPAYDTGTISVEEGSNIIVFSDQPDFDCTDWYIRVDGLSDTLRILSGTGVDYLLDQEAPETLEDVSFVMYKLDYEISSTVLDLLGPMRIARRGEKVIEVEMVDEAMMNYDYPIRDAEEGAPNVFCMVTENIVRFNKYPPDVMRVEYDAHIFPNDLVNGAEEEPIIPREYRKTLADIALLFLLMDKEDDKVAIVNQWVQAGIKSMAIDNRKKMSFNNRNFGRLRARAKSRRRVTTESGLRVI